MYIYQLLDRLITMYLKRLDPRIREIVAQMRERYREKDAGMAAETSADAAADAASEGYQVKSFGFQTLVMVFIMLVVFAVLCLILLILALAAGDQDFSGVQIFAIFTVLCLLMCVAARFQSGFVVYTRDWVYVERRRKRQAFLFDDVREMKVLGDLTLIYEEGSGDLKKAVIPLESRQYLDFTKFIEENHPEIIAKIPPEVYEKGRRKHISTWGNSR